MGMIQFVRNYEDLSTDRGYQFKFHCDKCGNGFMTHFQASTLGMASSFLNAASSFLGWGGQAGNAAYEVQRAVGGKAHDSALASAVEEARPNFNQCTRCGRWVCKDICWNPKANLCEECAPNYEEQLAASQAQAKVEMARQQLYEKARNVDYVKDIDMNVDAQIAAPSPNQVGPAKTLCTYCGSDAGSAKFCPECGKPVQKAGPAFCPECGAKSNGSKFCAECGHKF